MLMQWKHSQIILTKGVYVAALGGRSSSSVFPTHANVCVHRVFHNGPKYVPISLGLSLSLTFPYKFECH